MPTRYSAKGLDRLVRQPAIELLEGLLARIDFHPGDLALAAVNLFDRVIENVLRGAPDIRPGAVALDKRDDRLVRNVELAVGQRDFRAVSRNLDILKCHLFFTRFVATDVVRFAELLNCSVERKRAACRQYGAQRPYKFAPYHITKTFQCQQSRKGRPSQRDWPRSQALGILDATSARRLARFAVAPPMNTGMNVQMRSREIEHHQ